MMTQLRERVVLGSLMLSEFTGKLFSKYIQVCWRRDKCTVTFIGTFMRKVYIIKDSLKELWFRKFLKVIINAFITVGTCRFVVLHYNIFTTLANYFRTVCAFFYTQWNIPTSHTFNKVKYFLNLDIMDWVLFVIQIWFQLRHKVAPFATVCVMLE